MAQTQGLFLTADWTDTSGLFEANTSIRNPDHRFWKAADDSGTKMNSDTRTPQFAFGDSVVIGVNLQNAPIDATIQLNIVCALAKNQPLNSNPSMASPLQDLKGNMLCLINEPGGSLSNTIEGSPYRVTAARAMSPDTYNKGHSNRYEVSVVVVATSATAKMSRQFSYDPDMDVDNGST